jgi:hypothetical protein
VRAVAARDLDGDGDMDIAAALSAGNAIVWFENDGATPPVFAPHTISGVATFAISVGIQDFDSDGDLDVLSAALSANTIAWHENLAGDGSAWQSRTISAAADGAAGVLAADLDRDGDLDAAAVSFNDDRLTWFRNLTIHRNALFPAEAVVSTIANGARAVAAGDINGDGSLDLVSASEFDDEVNWYANSGNGSSWTATQITNTADGAQDTTAADADGDGDLDVVTASANDDRISWSENQAGDGTAWVTATISAAMNGAQSVSTGDVDGDGDLDVLAASERQDLLVHQHRRRWQRLDGDRHLRGGDWRSGCRRRRPGRRRRPRCGERLAER